MKRRRIYIASALLITSLSLGLVGCGKNKSDDAEESIENIVDVEEDTEGENTEDQSDSEENTESDDENITDETVAENNNTDEIEAETDDKIVIVSDDDAKIQEIIDNSDYDSLEFSTLMYIYYRSLTESERNVYKQLFCNISLGIQDVELVETLSDESIRNVMTALYCDNPGFFWFDNKYTTSNYGDGVGAVSIEYNSLADDLALNKQTFNSKVESLMDGVNGGRAEKEKAIHDKIVDVCKYNDEADNAKNAYGCLIDGEASSSGYSKAMQLLLQKLEVPCYFVEGKYDEHSNTSKPVEHYWNVIRIKDTFYNVDAALDDKILDNYNIVYYGYYNQSDDVFDQDHTKISASTCVPKADGGAYDYKSLYGQEAETSFISGLGLESADVVNSKEEYMQRTLQKITGEGEFNTIAVATTSEVANESRYSVLIKTFEKDYLLNKVKNEFGIGWPALEYDVEIQNLSNGYALVLQYTKVGVGTNPDVNKETDGN